MLLADGEYADAASEFRSCGMHRQAADAYIEGVDFFLSAQPGGIDAFKRAISAVAGRNETCWSLRWLTHCSNWARGMKPRAYWPHVVRA